MLDNLSRSWEGVAATAFTEPWEEWQQGAAKLIELLEDSAHRLAQAAVLYEEQDHSAAQALEAASPEDDA
ncbi:WXG100 family type VII secretion target [Mycolicibacterium smegmatis]|uniref:WXG100 family type VII secretion target n=1 Tax=Mycolicibacterium smegmatis TaxID=1772 RepID=UPI001E5EC421|nr:WXG100 family type VII secretion target [Mycolicibacterium smegmatis]UGU29883.1 WXG100 family type VII secretion target [Mycolicibacterium smegmatis]ULN70820.1 WXG100 family type VII secretion target [Mycolicibacterium smegmatis]